MLGLVALVVVYLLRWTLLQEPVSTAIETAVFDSTGVEVEIGTIRGNMLREIRVDALRTVEPNPDGVLHSMLVSDVIIRYRLPDLLPFLSLTNLPLPQFTSPAVDLDWLERGELTPGLVVSNLSRTIPGSLTIDLHGEAVVNTPGDRGSASFDLRLDSGASGESPEARVALSGIESTWWPGAAGDSLALVFALAPGRLSLRTDPERTSQGVRIDGALESSEVGGRSALTLAEFTVAAGRFRAHGAAGLQSAELVASLPADDGSNEIVNRTLDDPSLVAGALDLDAVLRLAPGDGQTSSERSVVAELFSAPALLMQDAEVSASIDARSWRLASVTIDRLASSARFVEQRLSVDATSAEVEVEGLDLATASDPGTGFTLSLDGGGWDTVTNEVRVDGLVVHGGGGRLQVNGLVTLPQDDAGLESVSGDLAGQLSVKQPDELAALLARIGVAPLLPAGYSIGTSVTADFALSGSRTDAQLDARLDVGFRAQGPAVPGLAFESIEAEAAITSDSVTTSRLRVQAVEVLAIAAASDPGTGFTISIDDAGWDPATNEVSVDDLIVEGGGARLTADGLVTIPPASSGLESVSGELAGRLSIEQPDELAALLARVGIAPRLPAGYSIGTSLALDFALGESRAGTDARLEVELGVQRPAVPGLAFESIEAEAAITSKSVTVSRLQVRTAEALGTLEGFGSFTTERLELELDAQGIPLAFLVGLVDPNLSSAASGTVSVLVSAEGSPESPTVTLRAEGDSLAVDDEPVTIDVDVRQEAGEVRLAALTIEFADLIDLRGTGSAPVSFGIGGLTTGDFDRAELEVSASLRGVVEQWPEATLELSGALDGRAASLSASGAGFVRTEELTIVGIEPITEFQLAATVTDALDPFSAFTAELTSGDVSLASVKAGTGSGIVGEARLPLAALSHFVPGVDLPGGLLRASFRTDADGANAQGRVDIDDAMVKFSAQVPTVGSLSGSLVYADEVIRIDDLSGEMGGSPITLSGTYSLVDDEDSPIEIRLGGENALLARSPDMQVRADVDMEVSGSFESMRLAGDIGIIDASYNRPIQLFSLATSAASPSADLQLFGVDAAWARSVLLDVAVTADRTIVMSNNIFEGAFSADMTIGGNLAVPRPAGRVFTDTGAVRLPTARLNVEDLEVRFPADSAFAPRVRLIATTSIQGYDMNVTVDGQLPNVEVRIISAPPLPTDEALLLLTTGSRSSGLSFVPDVSGALTAVGTVFGRQILNQIAQQMNEEDREFLERIDFEVERERESGQIGEVGVEYRLGEDENWVLLFDRKEEDSYTLQLAWRLWID